MIDKIDFAEFEKIKLYDANTDTYQLKSDVLKIIMKEFDCTLEQAESHLDYSLKHGILYTEEDYIKYFCNCEE